MSLVESAKESNFCVAAARVLAPYSRLKIRKEKGKKFFGQRESLWTFLTLFLCGWKATKDFAPDTHFVPRFTSRRIYTHWIMDCVPGTTRQSRISKVFSISSSTSSSSALFIIQQQPYLHQVTHVVISLSDDDWSTHLCLLVMRFLFALSHMNPKSSYTCVVQSFLSIGSINSNFFLVLASE